MSPGRHHRPDPAAVRARRLADLLRRAAESGDHHTARALAGLLDGPVFNRQQQDGGP